MLYLDYGKQEKAQYNKPFMDFYGQLRDTFLTGLQGDNPQLDIRGLYDGYNILSDGVHGLNGDWSGLPEEKREFLLERAQWQADLLALGVTVPQTQ